LIDVSSLLENATLETKTAETPRRILMSGSKSSTLTEPLDLATFYKNLSVGGRVLVESNNSTYIIPSN
jgi:hypothetical protein